MKKTRRKNIFRSIRGSLNRFLSILFIVALGSGFMAGLAATSPDMYDTADRYMDEYNWYDIDIKSTLGFTQTDIDAIKALSFSETVQSANTMDLVLSGKDSVSYTSRVFGILDESGNTALNRFQLTEGRLPRTRSECVVQSVMGRYSEAAPAIGDVLSFSKENADYETLRGSVSEEKLTVVGTVEGPMCISIEGDATNIGSGSVALHVYVPEDYYTLDFFTDIFLTVSGAHELNTFSEEYSEKINEAADRLEALSEKHVPIRANEVRAQAEEALRSAEDVIRLLEDLKNTQISLGEDAAMRAAYNAETAKILAGAGSELAGMLSKMGGNLADRLQGLQDTPPEEPALLSELKRSQEGLQKAMEEASDGAWFIRTRDDSSGYAGYDSNVGKVAALSKIFPVFFFLVALLVALTTMTRLVEEKRTQTGTLKALGFSNLQILSEYLFYSLLASVLGCVLGFVAGFRLFPWAISSAYGMMYFLPDTATPFRLNIALWIAPVTVVSIISATLWACFDEVRSCPARLMMPKAPAAGKRIWLERLPFVWKRIPFTHKVTFRNLFRYKKRFFMTILGVAGCTALLVTGFGVRDSVNDIVDKQFGEIYRYELTVLCDKEDAVTEDEELHSFLEDKKTVAAWLPFAQESGKVSANGKSGSVTLTVPQRTEASVDFISLRERKSGKKIAFPEQGTVLTEKLCEELQVGLGDFVTIENADGRRAEVQVASITENYIAAFSYLSPEAYKAAFGKLPDYTTLLCRLAEEADTEITSKVLKSDHVIYARSSVSLKETFSDSIKSINGVVLVLILAAGLLSVVVLYNLNNVNICERRKELSTLRVLGFQERESERYIFRETNVLSLIGSFFGLFVGIWLHSFVVRTVELDQVMFGRNIYPQSYFYALLISVLFTLLVNQIMRRTIRKIDMVEAMKAND